MSYVDGKIEFPFDTELRFSKFVKHKAFPKNDFEKQAILIKLLDDFEDGKKYMEQEVNEKLKKHFEDYTLLRRELINFGYMRRNSLTGGILGSEEDPHKRGRDEQYTSTTAREAVHQYIS